MKRIFLIALGGLFFATLANAETCLGSDCKSACLSNQYGKWIEPGSNGNSPRAIPGKCICTGGAALQPDGTCQLAGHGSPQ